MFPNTSTPPLPVPDKRGLSPCTSASVISRPGMSAYKAHYAALGRSHQDITSSFLTDRNEPLTSALRTFFFFLETNQCLCKASLEAVLARKRKNRIVGVIAAQPLIAETPISFFFFFSFSRPTQINPALSLLRPRSIQQSNLHAQHCQISQSLAALRALLPSSPATSSTELLRGASSRRHVLQSSSPSSQGCASAHQGPCVLCPRYSSRHHRCRFSLSLPVGAQGMFDAPFLRVSAWNFRAIGRTD